MSRIDKLLVTLFTALLINFFVGSIISNQPVESVFYTDWYGYQGLSTKPGVWCLAKNVRRIVPGEELIYEQEFELFRPAAGPIGGKADSVECTEFVLTLAYWDLMYSDFKYKN